MVSINKQSKWVFWSSRQSIENEIPSVTAITETVVAVLLYWWIAIYFETYLALLASVIVAPFVLLRSEQSVTLGAGWFGAWVGRFESLPDFWALRSRERWLTGGAAISAALVVGCVGYLLSGHSLARLEPKLVDGLVLGVLLTSLAIAISTAMAGGVAGPMTSTKLGVVAGIVGPLAALTLAGEEPARIAGVAAAVALPLPIEIDLDSAS